MAKTGWLAHVNRWIENPVAFVREVFGAEPDAWQADVLMAFPSKKRIAMKANKGPGKSTVLAWMLWNFIATRPDANIICTSISGDNLKDGLWKEAATWFAKSKLLQSLFVMTSTRIEAKHSPKTWFASARTWPKGGSAQEQADSLAGFHANFLLFLIDEAGGIPDAVMAAAEGGLAGHGECKMVIAGNPTHREGPLFRACTTESKLWHTVEITGDPDDPKRAPRVPIEWCREQIEKYGRDNPYVLVNVFGQFPPYSFNALIGDDEVRDAMGRMYRETDVANDPRILGIDVARMGDDMSVIAKRQGRQIYPLIRRRNVPDGQTGARLANRIWTEFNADAAFIDATGGFGLTWHDCLHDLGRATIPVGFAQKATADERYFNRRAEMAFGFIQWIKEGGALPARDQEGSAELAKALVNTNFTFKGDKLILEDKDDVKAKIGHSPDEFDACILTFAEKIAKTHRGTPRRDAYSAVTPYSPFGEVDRMMQLPVMGATSNYDPFSR